MDIKFTTPRVAIFYENPNLAIFEFEKFHGFYEKDKSFTAIFEIKNDKLLTLYVKRDYDEVIFEYQSLSYNENEFKEFKKTHKEDSPFIFLTTSNLDGETLIAPVRGKPFFPTIARYEVIELS